MYQYLEVISHLTCPVFIIYLQWVERGDLLVSFCRDMPWEQMLTTSWFVID